MLEESISVLKTNVVVLSENITVRQVLGEDEVTLGNFQPTPWDPPLAAACRSLCKIIQATLLCDRGCRSLTIELAQKFANKGLLIRVSLAVDCLPARQHRIPLAVCCQLNVCCRVHLLSVFLTAVTRLHPWECVALAYIY